MISESAFWAVDRCEGAADVIVSFSAVNTRPESFMMRRILADFPAQRVYLNCPGNQWYLDGVPGLGDSPEATADSLSALIDGLRGPGGRVLFFGGSMGGYGAVEYGSRCAADVVLATGVEAVLNIPTGMSAASLKGRMPVEPLVDLLARSQPETILMYGEGCTTDMYCAITLAPVLRGASRIITIPGRGHKLPAWLEHCYGFKVIFSALLRGQDVPVVQEDRGDLTLRPELVRAMLAAHLTARGQPWPECDAPEEYLSNALADPGLTKGQRAAAACSLADLRLRRMAPGPALAAAEVGLACMPDDPQLNELATRAAHAAGQKDRSYRYLSATLESSALDLALKDVVVLSRLLLLCLVLGALGPGLRLAQRYMPRNPNPRLWKLYEALMTRHLAQVRQNPAVAWAAMQDVQAP